MMGLPKSKIVTRDVCDVHLRHCGLGITYSCLKNDTVLMVSRQCFLCIGNKNKPPAMQVCSQTALASSKKPPCYNEYKVRQPNHYNKEESKWTIIVYHTQNGHANII